MSTLVDLPVPEETSVPGPGLTRRTRLPRWAPGLVAVVAIAAAAIPGMALGWSPAAVVVVAAVLYLVGLPAWSRLVEDRRAAVDRLSTSLVWVSLLIALSPLVSMAWQVVSAGLPEINTRFLTWSMRNVVGEPGGIYHALIGTALVTLTATVIAVPIGLLTAVWLVEYAGASRSARTVRFLVDVMTGIPSIVAGLFAYALFGLIFGPGTQLGLGGGVALALLMIPIVVRSTEEMLKLVPDELREASYALGVPTWRTITRVVLPTARPGIVTGVTLAIARVIGETAPLLIICGSTDSLNFNLFDGQMSSLPVFIYRSYTQPGLNPEILRDMAWGAALVLIVLVLTLNVIARLIGRLLGPRR